MKQHTRYREPLDPGLKLAVTLRHLVSGVKYSDMQYSWRVNENTLSVIVRDVCHAICEEYVDEVMTAPSTPKEWRQLADGFLKNWNFPNCVAAIDGTHIAIRKPASSGSLYYIIRDSSASSYWPLSTRTTSSYVVIWVVSLY